MDYLHAPAATTRSSSAPGSDNGLMTSPAEPELRHDSQRAQHRPGLHQARLVAGASAVPAEGADDQGLAEIAADQTDRAALLQWRPAQYWRHPRATVRRLV